MEGVHLICMDYKQREATGNHQKIPVSSLRNMSEVYLIPYTKNKVVQSKEHTAPIAEGYNASEDNRCYITVRTNSDD